MLNSLWAMANLMKSGIPCLLIIGQVATLGSNLGGFKQNKC